MVSVGNFLGSELVASGCNVIAPRAASWTVDDFPRSRSLPPNSRSMINPFARLTSTGPQRSSAWQERGFICEATGNGAMSWNSWLQFQQLEDPLRQRRRKASLRSSFSGNVELFHSHLDVKDLRESRMVGIVSIAAPEPLKVMIAGAPASGKGTQCELIAKKFGLTHISAGDLLRAEVSAGTEAGKIAKEYMNAGKLVPSEIVVTMVKNRLAKPDASAGWLLDGYPRSLEQAEALEAVGIRPNIFFLLDVPDDNLVARVVGRRSDPVTGKIYHLTYAPPENEEIASRLVQRFDDKEEKVKARVDTHHANVESVIGVYKDIMQTVDGNRPKLEVFADISNHMTARQKQRSLVH